MVQLRNFFTGRFGIFYHTNFLSKCISHQKTQKMQIYVISIPLNSQGQLISIQLKLPALDFWSVPPAAPGLPSPRNIRSGSFEFDNLVHIFYSLAQTSAEHEM